MTDTLLAEITARDEAAADGWVGVDTFAALDRHTLLMEVLRRGELIDRLRRGQPIA